MTDMRDVVIGIEETAITDFDQPYPLAPVQSNWIVSFTGDPGWMRNLYDLGIVNLRGSRSPRSNEPCTSSTLGLEVVRLVTVSNAGSTTLLRIHGMVQIWPFR